MKKKTFSKDQNILVLSDLHMGIRIPGDIFLWNQEEFISIIKKIITDHNVDQIVLNGDIFELYKYQLKDVIASNKKITNFLSTQNAIFIKGNHDLIHPEGRDSHTITNSKGQSIHFEHGHNADVLNGTKLGRLISRILFKLLTFITKSSTINKIYFKIIRYDDQVDRIPRKYNSYKYLKYALRLLKKFDVVVLSHTHKMESHHTYYLHSKKRYLNTGSCSLGRLQAIVINSETLHYETIKLDRNCLAEHADNLSNLEERIAV